MRISPLTKRIGMTALMAVIFFTLTIAFGRPGIADWKSEWERTVQAAKQEGQVTVYSWGSTAFLDEGVFQVAYPGIKVSAVAGRAGQLLQRLMTERRAGKVVADVYIDGLGNIYPAYQAGLLGSIKSALILPEVVDESKWWQGKHNYTDPQGKHIFRFQSLAMKGTIGYNTNMVRPEELKSFWDFLDPKWKGKIEARDIRQAGPGSAAIRFFYHHPELGPAFIKRLFGEMNVTLFRDIRVAVDQLATGKFTWCFFCSGGDIVLGKRQGLPIDTFNVVLKEGAGLYQQAGSIGLLDGTPHPNAAKVFINWFLSPEGQYTFQKVSAKARGSGPDSLRVDIPKDHVLPDERREDGVQYMDMDTPDRIDMTPVRKVFGEALARAGIK
jgi:ABC-type Fe3+ transport system substrate-binding protein